MKVLIYGGGAVGLGLASCLLKSQVEVCIIARADTVEALRKSGLVRKGIFGRFRAKPETFSAYESLNEFVCRPFDYILVCTKSFDSSSAADDISNHRRLLDANTKIVLCQNGWGNAEKFTSHFPKCRIYSARIITGFTRRKPNTVEVTVHADAIHIGSLFGGNVEEVDSLAYVIARGGIPAVTTHNIERDLWAKMLYNCALNPLGAILDVPYGAMAKNLFTKDMMNHITEEAFAVMTKAGFRTHWKTAEGFLKVFYDKLVPATADHKSSTLQDIAAGKRTEIDAITGEVLALADKHHIDAPYNRAIFSMIKFLSTPEQSG